VSDKSNGYEQVADVFESRRQSQVGAVEVRNWAATLPQGAAVLDLGCGHGVPITETLVQQGCAVHAVDASPRLVAAFRGRFPDVPVVCEAIEDSVFFDRLFDGAVAWGVMFLLPIDMQARVMARVSRVLKPDASFLFTSPGQECSWPDMLTGQESISPGAAAYRRMLEAEGFRLTREFEDEGENHYFIATKIGPGFDRKNRSGEVAERM
jgi:SAM-dependent methyltransferase